MMVFRSIVLSLCCLVATGAVFENDRPIIGILTQPLNATASYIAASYVKFVESAGARVVPLHFDASDAELSTLFYQINGLLLPGGGVNIKKVAGNRFREAADFLFGLALKANDNGDPFPVHGTCMGFQMLSVMVAQNDSVLCSGCYTTEGTPLPLDLTSAAKTSALFSGMPSALMAAVTRQNITENSHHDGIDIEEYSHGKLKDFFQVLSTNRDPNNARGFVSTVEARRYPISATQWHPEKNTFEWGQIGELGYAAIPHSAEAVLLSQYMGNIFVNRARHSSHKFRSTEAEATALIYRFAPVVEPHGYFAQVYVWVGTDMPGGGGSQKSRTLLV